MRRILLLPTIAFLVAGCSDQSALAPAPTDVPGLGVVAAPGEVNSFEMEFWDPYPMGTTIADENGLTFFYQGRELHCREEECRYPAEYWGEYTLHLPGSMPNIFIKLTNLGPRQNARLRVVTEAYVINPVDGSNGQMIKPSEAFDEDYFGVPLELAPGETVYFWDRWILPQIGKGLFRYVAKLYHRNEGGGPGNEEAGLIMTEEYVFCPYDPNDEG